MSVRRIIKLTIGMAVGLLIGQWLIDKARAADEATCARYGTTVERFVMLATGDDADLAQAVRGAAEAHCFVVDFPPLEISISDPIDDAFGTPPAEVASAAKPPTAKAPSQWEKKCRRYYGSFRIADGTVLRRGAKTRSRCPL